MPSRPALHAQWVDGLVWLVDEHNFDVVDVGVHRDMIFGDIRIHDAAEFVVDHRFFVQRHSDAPYHSAADLAGRGLGVQDAAGRNRADDAGGADDAELLIRLHFREDRGVRVVRLRAAVLERGEGLLLDAVKAAVPHRLGDRYRARCVALTHELAIRKHDLGGCDVPARIAPASRG
jgi:hypothetical protein